MNLTERCQTIRGLFRDLEWLSSKIAKTAVVDNFRASHPDLVDDLDFCFEVLAGKHKLGYTYTVFKDGEDRQVIQYNQYTIKDFVNCLKEFSACDSDIHLAYLITPPLCVPFICSLVNREFRLGYSNKQNMITDYSPMLAKRYPDNVHEQTYFIQEKLDGNRCITRYNYDTDEWEFWSRSGKPLKVNFDMSWAGTDHIFDGEIMTLGKAGSRDFNRTSGAINSKFTDKSALHYFIYDIVDPSLRYIERKEILDNYDKQGTGEDCQILPVLDELTIYVNPAYNEGLDEWLDHIVDKGGEGLILRDPYATYQCGKRSDALLKYKKVQTMDLRIIGWKEGNGKYEGAIGSFECATDDGTIHANVSGMPDSMHYSNPESFIGRIIEVAYFDISRSAANNYNSLRFPRLKRIRDDKDTTSTY